VPNPRRGSDRGPTLRELAVQALSSTERGYDLLAPRFDRTPFRTPAEVLAAVTGALRPLGPFRRGLDLCCGTGAGLGVLRELCAEPPVGVDFSAGMLAVAREAHPDARLVRADARALPFGGGSGRSGTTAGSDGSGGPGGFSLVVSFGAHGHFLPHERPALFAGVRAALEPGGLFAFPLARPPHPGSPPWWALLGFDTAMRVRNAVRRPPFTMYYRTWPLPEVLADLRAAGFSVGRRPLAALSALGTGRDGVPRAALVLARRPDGP